MPVSFGLLEAEAVQAAEQHLDLVPGAEGHARITGPCAGTEQLAGEDPTGASTRRIRAYRAGNSRGGQNGRLK